MLNSSALIMPPNTAVSDWMRLASPSGAEPTTCQPCANNFCRISAERVISLTSTDSRAVMGAGMVLGAAMAFHISRLKPLTPASDMLGNWGASTLRPLEVTPARK